MKCENEYETRVKGEDILYVYFRVQKNFKVILGNHMEQEDKKPTKSTTHQRADEIKPYVCKNLIAVLENPKDIKNIGTVIPNVNALGVEKTYIVDPHQALPDDWQDMRERKSLSKTSVSAIKWSFVKRFDNSEECIKRD